MQKQEMSLSEIKANIANILSNPAEDRVNTAYKIYEEIIKESQYSAEALRYFYEYPDDEEFSNKEQENLIFTAEDKRQFTGLYGKMIDGALETLLRKNLPCSEFYKELWDFIEHNTILTEKKQKAFAVYYTWIDIRLPYFELPEGIKMDNEIYQEKLEEMEPLLKKMRFILYTPMEQKTERASRIMQVLDEMKDEEDKAVMMAQVLGMIERRNVAALVRSREG